MKTSVKLLILSLLLTGLAGCATQESFRKMDASSRTRLVCNQEKTVLSAAAEIKQHQSKIKEINADLDRGYLVHQSCKTIEIEEAQPISCKHYDATSKQYSQCSQCSQDKKKINKRVCSDQVVELNVALSRDNLRRHQHQLEDAQDRHNQAYQQCQSKLDNMSSDQAYQYYMAQ